MEPVPLCEKEPEPEMMPDKVWAAVKSLSMQQKAIFILRFVEEMELEEIAGVMNLRMGTVKTHLFRAVSSVRREVGE